MKLTNAKLIQLHNAIAVLDAGHEVTVDGKSARRPFKYGALVHGPLQANARAIAPHVEAFNKANKAIYAQHSEPFINDKGITDQRITVAEFTAWKKATEELLEQTVQVKLMGIKLSELKRGTGEGENPIPTDVLTALGRVLIDDEKTDQWQEIIDPADDQPADAKA